MTGVPTTVPKPPAGSRPRTLAAEPPADRGLTFSDHDFQRVRRLIHQRAGISLHDGKRAMVYSRLSRRLRDTGYASVAAYLDALEGQDGAEWQAFINALTTNLTSFFREEHHFGILARALAERRSRVSAAQPLHIWCNAASTGEEPYSIAMTAVEALGPNPPVRILATDIDTQVLATAERGVYTAEGARGLTPQRLKAFFLRGTGANEGRIRVQPELARLIEFQPFNLTHSGWRFPQAFDIVFCRNVMIYFDAPTQRAILTRIHGVMKPQSLLFVGHSENFTDMRTLFALRGKTVYDRL